MNGNDFLDKLQHLDPALVAAADQEPQKERRLWRPNWGAWLAVAACLAVLCLPMALTHMIQNGLLPVSGAGYNTAADTSHQAPEAGGAQQETGGEFSEAYAETEDARKAAYSLETLPEGVSKGQTSYTVEGSGATYTWDLYQLDADYCQSFEGGVPPIEELFAYNQDASTEQLWHKCDTAEFTPENQSSFNEQRLVEDPQKMDLPTLSDPLLGSPEAYLTQTTEIAYQVEGYMEILNRLYIQWLSGASSDTEDGRPQNPPLISLNLCTSSQLTPEETAQMKDGSTETLAVLAPYPAAGPQVSVLGSAASDKVLTGVLANGSWFRIYCTAQVPLEDVQAVLDWVLAQDGLLTTLFGDPEALTSTFIEVVEAALPEELLPYLPTDPEWVPSVVKTLDTQKTSQNLEGNEARIYFAEDPSKPLSAWYIYSPETYDPNRPPQAYPKTANGALEALTYENVTEEYERQQASHESNSMPHTFRLSFFWNGYYVGGDFTENATREEILCFIDYLKSMDVQLRPENYSNRT